MFTIFCYAARPDSCAAFTVYPVWAWAMGGLVLLALGTHSRTRALVLALWIIAVCVIADEPHSLLRMGDWPDRSWEAARARGDALRVITLNCAGGASGAEREAAAYDPDIVFFQECPDRSDIEALARQLFGESAGVCWRPDSAIIARGKVVPAELPPLLRVRYSECRLTLESGRQIALLNLHAVPAIFRTDPYSPESWRDYRDNRRARREELRFVRRRLAAIPASTPVILGGDFNAPSGDAVFREVRPRLRDTFREAGRGWGNTMINEFPVVRIDQIWVSRHLTPDAVVARRTRHSDHRLVVCDLLLRKAGSPEH